MTYVAVIVVFIALIVFIFGGLWGPIYLRREKPDRRKVATRESYGPPPGVYRAVDHNELPDDRGWPGLDRVYEASTASAILHMIERSA